MSSRGKNMAKFFALLFLLCGTALTNVHAFQINPNKAEGDTQRASLAAFFERWAVGGSERFASHFKSANHEAISHAAFGCTITNILECATTAGENRAPDATLWGVRWNDDPPFRMRPSRAKCNYDITIRLNTQPTCWYALFTDAEKRALAGDRFGPGDALLYRSHFGDLQFLHSMASVDAEPPTATAAKALMWAEFTWGIATHSLPQNKFIRDLGVAGLGEYFPGDQTAAVLLALGNPQIQPHADRVSEAALGSLLHMVQDSFSKAHVERAEPTGLECEGVPNTRQPGKIVRFQNYSQQDGAKHDAEDAINALNFNLLEVQPSVAEVSQVIVRLWKDKVPWAGAKLYLDCVFALSDLAQNAGPGEKFRRD